MENKRHRLLERQIKKYLNGSTEDNPALEKFLNSVNTAYQDFENDHKNLERTLEISSNELFKANQILNESKKNLEETVTERTKELLTSNEKLVAEIHERTEAERKLKLYALDLESKNNELDKFAYIVSHDLKAPLRAISSLAEWIAEDAGENFDAGAKQNFGLLRGRAARMDALINGILDYSRAGKIKRQSQEIDTYKFTKELAVILQPPGHFKIEIADNLPVLNSDKIALEQVFSNYISNAIKYNNNPDPKVNISYEQQPDYHVFCVADNGEGIAPEFHEKIFVIFQTLNARDTVESTGVGLAIVKKIVMELGGRTWIDSDIGKGAKFYFSLPMNNN